MFTCYNYLMKSPHQQAVHKLITEMIYPFYMIDRDMELPIRETPENDAEHSWSLALGACALAPLLDSSLDVGKVAQFAIVHDLVEVYSGDVSIWDKTDSNHDNKENNERLSLEKIKSEYTHFPWIFETIDEYERKETNEAKYVWSVDKYLAMYMRYTLAEPFFTKKGITKKDFDTGIRRMSHKAHAHESVGILFDELIAEFDTHPEWFPN